MRKSLAVLLVLSSVVAAAAQTPPPGGSPVFHGVLEVVPAAGTIDRMTGDAVVRLHGWRFLLIPGSNGISPDTERVLIAIGSQGDNDLYLPPGSLLANRRRTVFTWRRPRGSTVRIKTIRITELEKDPATGIGAVYRVNATLTGVILSDLLLTTAPDCMPLAVIVGDDDAFSGVQLAEKNLDVRRIRVARSCSVGGDWPWLGR